MKKDAPKYLLGLGVLLGCFFTISTLTPAQNTTGVTDKEILIGSCSALEGPSHFLGSETVTGAKAYFAMVNDAAGVDGRKLKLVAYDDSYDPAKTEACFNRLMEQKVFALGFFVDRKSTRLNSSHLVISYAVFCLKKKNIDKVIDSHVVTSCADN